MSIKNIIYEVTHAQPLTRYTLQIFLRTEALHPIQYQAGQYIKVIDDIDHSPLSIACSPVDLSVMELHLSHAPQNQRAQHILQQVEVEKKLKIRGPYGTCTASRLAMNHPILFYVRGTGFAPAKAILEELVHVQSCPPLHLYWGAVTAKDLYLEDEVLKWKKQFADFRYTPVISRASEQDKLQQAVLADYPDLSNYQLYVSGPESMTHAALGVFPQHGLKRERFYSDIFDYDHHL